MARDKATDEYSPEETARRAGGRGRSRLGQSQIPETGHRGTRTVGRRAVKRGRDSCGVLCFENTEAPERIMTRSPIHPGEHLATELEELGMSAAELARRLAVPTNRITEILHGERAVTGDTALRLGHFFGTRPEFWLNLQKLCELRLAERKAGKAIDALPTLAERAKRPQPRAV